MEDSVYDLEGEDWEGFAGGLLRQRYAPSDVQAVPAVEGDFGIDYWIRGAGDIYQCYGVEYGVSRQERLRRQKSKLGREARKLKQNDHHIAQLIAPIRCRRYIFFVPKFDDKNLLTYAAGKAAELRDASLEFCTADFEIAVQCLDDFQPERSALLRLGAPAPRLAPGSIGLPEVHQWIGDNGTLASNIRAKSEDLLPAADRERIDSYVQKVVEQYLAWEQSMQGLEQPHAEIYEQVRRAVTHRRRRLDLMGGRAEADPRAAIRAELNALEDDLRSPPINLEAGDASTLSTGVVAAWLAECTLSFR